MPNKRKDDFLEAVRHLNETSTENLSDLLKIIGLDPKQDLAFSDASEADLRGENYSNANLEGCLLISAKLENANFSGANLRYADLSNASLRFANLSGADLSHALLRDADISGANLNHASLIGADITGANLSYVTLLGANLSDVIGKGIGAKAAAAAAATAEAVINAPGSHSSYEKRGYECRDVYGIYKSYRGRELRPRFMGADTLLGEDVYDSKGEDLGDIKEIMLDMNSGKVAYAVLSFRGFLGMGGKRFAVPWNALTLDTVNKRFLLDMEKEQLESAPGFDKDDWPDMMDPTWQSTVHSFYGTTPYSDRTTYTDTSDYSGDYTGKKPASTDTNTQSTFIGDKPKRY